MLERTIRAICYERFNPTGADRSDEIALGAILWQELSGSRSARLPLLTQDLAVENLFAETTAVIDKPPEFDLTIALTQREILLIEEILTTAAQRCFHLRVPAFSRFGGYQEKVTQRRLQSEPVPAPAFKSSHQYLKSKNNKMAAEGRAPLSYQLLNCAFNPDASLNRIASVISRHEGRPDSINWNDNGAGISIGSFQANQKKGEMPYLLQRMERANSPLFTKIMGDEIAHLVRNAPEKIRAVSFTDPVSQGPNTLGKRLKEALRQSAFQQVQAEMLKEKINHAAFVANQYGIKSERGVALVADLINQLGEGQSHGKMSGARRYLMFALRQPTETAKLTAIAAHDMKGFGRAFRDKDILCDPSLSGCDLSKTAQAQNIAVHSETNNATCGHIRKI